MQKIQLLVILLGLLLLNSCGESNTDCRYGDPQAIFSDKTVGGTNHSFEVKNGRSTESIDFVDIDFSLELFQSGCEEITQEFRFHLRGDLPKDTPASQCALIIAGIFQALSQQDPNLFQLGGWADAVGQSSPDFQYNELINLKGHPFSAQLDKTHGENSAIVTLVLKSSSEQSS